MRSPSTKPDRSAEVCEVVGSGQAPEPMLHRLSSGRNFRDLGGQTSTEGPIVRKGLVFRAAALTPADGPCLRQMGIRTVVDLRSTSEREARPSVADLDLWSRDYDSSDADLLSALGRTTTTAAEMRSMMIETYRTLIDEQAPSFAKLFRIIARGAVPVVFHCAAGKDRTGIAAALLLALLGVRRDRIEEDYLRTRDDNGQTLEGVRATLAHLGVTGPDEDVLAAVLDADPAYLAAMFDEIEKRYGTVETYAFRSLGLVSADLAGIRNRLLDAEVDHGG